MAFSDWWRWVTPRKPPAPVPPVKPAPKPAPPPTASKPSATPPPIDQVVPGGPVYVVPDWLWKSP